MFLIWRKQAVIKMSKLDGSAKSADIVYLLKKNTNRSFPKCYSSTFMTHTAPDKHVFDARNLILNILQRQEGEFLT